MASKLVSGIALAASMFLTAPLFAQSAQQQAAPAQQQAAPAAKAAKQSAKQAAKPKKAAAQPVENDAAWAPARLGKGATVSRVTSRPIASSKMLPKKVLNLIADAKDSTLTYVKGNGSSSDPGDTYPLDLVPHNKGVKLTVPIDPATGQEHEPDYDNYSKQGYHTKYDISGVGADGHVSFTAILPVSGHVNQGGMTKNQTALHFAKTNVYNIEVIHPDGAIEHIDGVAAGGELIKTHDLGIKLSKGSTFVRFYPVGSFGVNGYYNGRVVELRWDGTTTVAKAAPAQQAAPSAMQMNQAQ